MQAQKRDEALIGAKGLRQKISLSGDDGKTVSASFFILEKIT
jgi:hypothetical protein